MGHCNHNAFRRYIFVGFICIMHCQANFMPKWIKPDMIIWSNAVVYL